MTIEGPRESSFQDFIKHSSRTRVTDFFLDIVQLLHFRGIVDYHLVLTNKRQRHEHRTNDDHHNHNNDPSSSSSRDSPHRRHRAGGRPRKLEEEEEDTSTSTPRKRRSSRSPDTGGRRSSMIDMASSSSSSSTTPQTAAAGRLSSSSLSSSSCWCVVVYYGGEARKDFSGPIEADRCMSCDLGTSMMTGLTGNGEGGPSSEDSLIYQDALMRYWHDAKGRALFVVTPRRHVRALKELNRDEIYQLWRGSIQIMDDMGCSGTEDLRDMILNAGVDQNHSHLHLKVRVSSKAFERARRKWSERRNRLVDRLRDFAESQDK